MIQDMDMKYKIEISHLHRCEPKFYYEKSRMLTSCTKLTHRIDMIVPIFELGHFVLVGVPRDEDVNV